MDSKEGRSEMQIDAGATSKDTAAGKGKTRQERKRKKKVPAKGKKAEEPSVMKWDSTVKETRRPPPVYKLTIPADEDRDAFHKLWLRNWGDEITSMDEESTLQFFEAKISPKQSSGLMWPLRVYGFIAARDLLDYKRNIIFKRERDNCQIINESFPYLTLTGPARAVVLVDPVCLEVELRVKGIRQSEDQDLIFLAKSFRNTRPLDSSVFKPVYTGKISTLELSFGHILRSVEASVTMKVIHGSWPDGFHGSFAATTASINNMTISLLETRGNDKLPLADDGTIKLQRHVVCAETIKGERLKVSVRAYGVADGQQFHDALLFKPQQGGRLYGTLNIDSCEIGVTVIWSLIKWC
ncbi:unnamed protein product [Alopecurus aequalis]